MGNGLGALGITKFWEWSSHSSFGDGSKLSSENRKGVGSRKISTVWEHVYWMALAPFTCLGLLEDDLGVEGPFDMSRFLASKVGFTLCDINNTR